MSINRMVFSQTSYFGEGARFEIVTEIKKKHYKKAFLVSDHDLNNCGVVSKIEEVLQQNEIPYVIDLEVKPNPTIDNVLEGLTRFQKSEADFIVALGGGSVIDTAKAIATIAHNPENIDVVSLEGMDVSENEAVPILAVPTTAGTGSETTMDFVITNVKEKRKMACMDSKVVPKAAFLDTELMASMPMRMTAATAMDALTHAIESYLSLGAFSFSEALSLQAISLISKNLLRVLQNPQDLEARKEIAIAQFMAGMSFTNVGLGIVHSMAHPLSAFYDTPHGVANALVLPYVLEFNALACPDKMKILAKIMSDDYQEGLSSKQATQLCVEKIHTLNTLSMLPEHLEEIGAKKEDIDELAISAYEDASTPDNPRKVNVEILKQLYTSMFKD